jgi:YidC/Oxa1 family membrane protein insertase
MQQDDTDYKRLFTAIFLAAALLIFWQAMVEWPKRQKLAQYTIMQAKKQEAAKIEYAAHTPMKEIPEENPLLSRADRLAASPRITIHSPTLSGSIDLKGARLDDLTLAKYRETVDPQSPEVTLLSPAGDDEAYFAQVGWVSQDGKTKIPTGDTLWQADKKELAPGQPVTLRWNNGEGQTFEIEIALDENYMFTLTQHVRNQGAAPVAVLPYAFLNRTYEEPKKQYAILHEGPLGVMEGSLAEIKYKELREKGNKLYEQANGWLGITDKYWLTALVPQGEFKATFSHYNKGSKDRYQVDYLGTEQIVAPGASTEQRLLLFAGAKEFSVIDRYADGDAATHTPPIPLFDRAIDFGSLYFLTKPMLLLLTFFNHLVGNFGVAILLLTIVVKLLMYPLANKSFHSMAQMRELQPEIKKLNERYVDDAIARNKAMMELYKKEKVNPASGCMPLLIQMPVFFALYKVLYVSLEMRHAPFFGWIHDLSAPDSSNIFTLFGLLNWNHPAWLQLSVLPMLMCATMVFQMKQQPKPADPVQAKMMTYMPYFFLFIFSSFPAPAGLVLYWTWSNLLSIIQQQVISKQHHKKMQSRKAKAA